MKEEPSTMTSPTHVHEWERGSHMVEAFGVDGRKPACAICGIPKPESTPSKTEHELEELLRPEQRDPEIGHAIRTFGESIEEIGLREISEDRPLTDNELRAAAYLARQVVAHVYGDQTLVLPALLAERKRLRGTLQQIAEHHEPRGNYCNVCGGNWPCLTNEWSRSALLAEQEATDEQR